MSCREFQTALVYRKLGSLRSLGGQDVHDFANAEGGSGVKLTGRGARIRTADLLRPRQARYQTAPRPDRDYTNCAKPLILAMLSRRRLNSILPSFASAVQMILGTPRIALMGGVPREVLSAGLSELKR